MAQCTHETGISMISNSQPGMHSGLAFMMTVTTEATGRWSRPPHGTKFPTLPRSARRPPVRTTSGIPNRRKPKPRQPKFLQKFLSEAILGSTADSRSWKAPRPLAHVVKWCLVFQSSSATLHTGGSGDSACSGVVDGDARAFG